MPGRSPLPLRNAALAAGKRVGTVEMDHGDTACKTADAAESIGTIWARAGAQGFESPSAHETSGDPLRTRC